MSGYGQSSGGFPSQSRGGWKSPAQNAYGSTAMPFDGLTQNLGNGMSFRQMGPSMLPFRNSGPDYFPQRPGSTQDMGGGMSMRQMGPSMLPPWMQQKAWTPPPPPGTTPQQPTQPPPTQPPGQPKPPGDFGPLPPGQPPTPPPNQPAPPPGVTTDPSGRMTYGGQPVKFNGTKYVYDTTPFVPGAGQWGQYGAPGAGGFTLDQSSGKNMILGGANGPQMYNAEGLVQGGQAPQNFVNYLNSYRR